MKKNKLFTILAAITLLTGVGAEASANLNANVVQAAKRTKKSKGRKKTTRRSKKTNKKRTSKKTRKPAKSRKAAPYAIVKIRRGAPVYIIKFNKAGTAVSRIYRQKRASFKAIRAYAYWWTRYRGVSYYYLPGVVTKATSKKKNLAVAVRTTDTRVTTKKKPFSLDAQNKKVNKVRARAAYWNRTINNARPKAYKGTIKTTTPYFVQNSSGKTQRAGTLNAGQSVEIAFQLAGTSNGQPLTMDAIVLNNAWAFVPAQYVTVDNGATIPSAESYSNSLRNFQNLIAKAKKEGFVFRTAK